MFRTIQIKIKLWDIAGQKLIRTLTGDTSTALALAFSPDGSLLVSSTTEGTVDLWDLEEGQQLVSMISLGDGSEWLQVTPDGLDRIQHKRGTISKRYKQPMWRTNHVITCGLTSDTPLPAWALQ